MNESTVVVKSYRDEIEGKLTSKLEEAMNKIGMLVENDAKKNANNPRGGSKHPYVQSGDLSSNIGHTTQINGNSITSIIGFSREIKEQSPVNYATIIELGSPNGRQPPYPFLFPAVESNRQNIINLLKG